MPLIKSLLSLRASNLLSNNFLRTFQAAGVSKTKNLCPIWTDYMWTGSYMDASYLDGSYLDKSYLDASYLFPFHMVLTFWGNSKHLTFDFDLERALISVILMSISSFYVSSEHIWVRKQLSKHALTDRSYNLCKCFLSLLLKSKQNSVKRVVKDFSLLKNFQLNCCQLSILCCCLAKLGKRLCERSLSQKFKLRKFFIMMETFFADVYFPFSFKTSKKSRHSFEIYFKI